MPFEVLDVSFSSYLNDTQDTCIRKLALPSQTQISSLVPIPPQSAYVGKKKVEDGEIGIFGAEKYFTEAIDEENSVIPNKGNKPSSTCQQERDELVVDESPVKHKTQPGTPSVRSEASWNSRSALLQTNPRNQHRKEVNKVSNVKSFLAVLGCNCNGKNSVEVSEKNCEDRVIHSKEITKPVKAGDLVVRTTKSLSSRWAEEEIQSKKLDPNSKREDGFSFPVISSKAGDQAVKIQLQEEKEIIRNSLEVFGSPIMEKAKKSFSLERKLTMLNWDGVTPRVQDIEIPPNQNGMYNDTESDASSDLFEIESFSTNGNPFPGRHAPEAMSRASNGYAPSEASIDWSVATASAADASVISDYKEIRNGTVKSSSMIAWSMNIDHKTGKEVVQKRAPSILSGCKSLKSVRVAGDEYRTTTSTDQRAAVGSPRGRLRLESGTPITKFQAETKLTGFDSRSRGQNGFGTRSHSPHTSHLLYIQ